MDKEMLSLKKAQSLGRTLEPSSCGRNAKSGCWARGGAACMLRSIFCLLLTLSSLFAEQETSEPHVAASASAAPPVAEQKTKARNLISPEELSQAIATTVRQTLEEQKGAVIQVEALDERGKLYGSGFFADPFGTIYTLSSVATGATSLVVIQGTKRLPARLLVSDSRSGLALIKVKAEGAFLVPGDSSKLQIGDPLLAIGYPQALQESPSFGIIAGFDRRYGNSYFSTTHIRTSIPVQRGFGGAPVLNMRGEVIGIIVSGLEGGGGCYILPIAAMEKIWKDFERFGEIRHGWMGVLVAEAPDSVAGSTATISGLEPGTPAASCGLKRGDVIIRIGETQIHTAEDVLDASFFLTAGELTSIEIIRAGEEMTLEVRSVTHPHANTSEIQVEPLNLRSKD